MFGVTFVIFFLAVEVGYLTNVFVASCAALRLSIERFAIWELSSEGKVDFCAAYRNFFIMAETVRSFSSAWRRYFFVAEFGLVLATVSLCVAAVHEGARLIDTVSEFGELSLEVAEQAFRVASAGGFATGFVVITMSVWYAAASVTAQSLWF